MIEARRERGLTLLEVVIALTILSVIGIIAVEAFRLSVRSWDRGERQAEREQYRRVLASMVAGELAAMLPVTVQLGGRAVVGFRGESERVVFHAAPEPRETLPLGAMVRSVTYSVERGKGLLLQKGYVPVEGKPTLDPVGAVAVVHPDVTRLRFRYLVPGDLDTDDPRWVDRVEPEDAPAPQPPGARPGILATAPRAPRGLPLAIEVRLGIGETLEEQDLVLLVPVRVGRGL